MKKKDDKEQEAHDPWKEKLQETLKRERPSARRWGFWLAFVLLGLLVLVAWWLYPRPAPPLPPLITFDVLIVPAEEAPVLAIFAQPEEGNRTPSYKGRMMSFQESRLPGPGQDLSSAKVTLGEEGVARATLKTPADLRKVAFKALVTGKTPEDRAEDQAHIFTFEPASDLLLVTVEGTLSRLSAAEWEKAKEVVSVPEAAPALQAARKRGFQVAYLALEPQTPLAYKKMRLWVHARSAGESFLPEGPVLGRMEYPGDAPSAYTKVLASLKDRFTGRRIAVTSDVEIANRLQAGGWRTILVADGPPLPNIERLRGWEELAFLK